MNRRDFLKLLGAAGAAAAVGPATILPATAKEPELLVTRYQIGPESLQAPMTAMSGLVLEAPWGQRCRALIHTHADVVAVVGHVHTWNEPGISISHFGHEGPVSEFITPTDSSIFLQGVDLHSSIVCSHQHALQIDYERTTPDDAPELLLMLRYNVVPPAPPGYPPPFGWPEPDA